MALIDPDRLVDWTPGTAVGVPGGIPTSRSNIIDVTQAPYNADNTGVNDCTTAINNALAAAAAQSIVYLPAGTYRCNSQLFMSYNDDNITLRGAGPHLTTIDSRVGSSGTALMVGGDGFGSVVAVSSGTTKGSTQVVVASTSAFSNGQLVKFTISNDDTIPVVHVSGTTYLRSHMAVVTSKTATALNFSPPLYEDYSGQTVRVQPANVQNEGQGIEDITIDCTNGSQAYGICFDQCYGCWIKNVKVRKVTNYSVFFFNSLKCEMRLSRIDEIKTTAANGSGLIFDTSCACLIEDNIIYKAFPLVEINKGSSGNVFGYNFAWDSNTAGVVGAAIDSNHGPHNNYNLYEGNISSNVQADGYFGSVSDDVLYRNWLHGLGVSSTSRQPVLLQRFTRDYSIIGNLLGKNGVPYKDIGGVTTGTPYSFGLPNMGNNTSSGTASLINGDPWADWGTDAGPTGFQEKDLDVETTTTLKANYDIFAGEIPPEELAALGSDVLVDSLYLSSKPSWWGDSLAWPPFDPLNPNADVISTSVDPATGLPLGFATIPSGFRFLYGDGSNPTVLRRLRRVGSRLKFKAFS